MPEEKKITLQVTQLAETELKQLLARQKKPLDVRLYVVSGVFPTIHMNLDTAKPGDAVVEASGIKFVIDPLSTRYLDDAKVDCVLDAEGPAFKITGPNVPEDVESKGKPTETTIPPTASNKEKEEAVRKALKKVFDPEIPMNIVDLGLIYAYEWNEQGKLNIRMTMTSPGCPVADILVEEVKRVADDALGGDQSVVEVVWEPPWGPDKMSEFAKRQFGYA